MRIIPDFVLKTFSVTWGYSSLEFGPTSFGSQSPEYLAPSLHSIVFPSFLSIWQLQIAVLKALVHQYIAVTIFLWSSRSSTDSPKWTRRSPGSVTYSLTCDWNIGSVNIYTYNRLTQAVCKKNEWMKYVRPWLLLWRPHLCPERFQLLHNHPLLLSRSSFDRKQLLIYMQGNSIIRKPKKIPSFEGT